jgi:hypothetical protein
MGAQPVFPGFSSRPFKKSSPNKNQASPVQNGKEDKKAGSSSPTNLLMVRVFITTLPQTHMKSRLFGNRQTHFTNLHIMIKALV